MTPARFSFRVPAALILILVFFPVVHAADCLAGCSCMLPTEAKTMGYEACGGKLTVCGYASSGAAKYCYATTRATQKPALSGFTESECPPISGLTLIAGYTLAKAAPNRDGLYCQYSLPGSCPYPNEPCSAILRIERTLNPGAARDLMNTNFPPGSIAEITKIYTVVDSGQTPDHRYIIFHNDPGNNNPLATNIAGAILYREVYVIEAASQGYWVTSDATAKATLTALENGGKSVVDRTTLQPTTKPSTTKPSVTTTPRGTLTSGSTGVTINPPGYIAWPTPENPDESEALQQFLNDILGGFESGPDEDGDFAQSGPVDWSGIPAAASASMTPAAIGAFGAFFGIVLGAYTILPDGGFSWSGWPEGGTGPRSDDQAVPTKQVNGPGTDMALFPARGTIDMVDPAYREKVKEWLKNQVYFAGHWYVTDDGKYVASNFMLPDNPTPENTKIPIDELLSVDQFSAPVPFDLHLNLAMQAAAQIPLDDLEKLRRGRWSTLPDSEREALLRRLAPVFGAPINATDTRVDIWKPGLVRPEGGPTAPIPDNVPAQQYKINHGHGNFESHIELNSTNPGWKEDRALNAVIMVGHELKHTQQGSVVDMEGYTPDDISTRNILVRQSYNSAYNPSIDPSRYAGNYIERDAQSYGTKLAAQISKRLRNPDTKTAIKALDDTRKANTGAH